MDSKRRRTKNKDAIGLRRMRLDRGLKREYVARTLGISGGQLGMYESGKSEPSPTRICELAEIYRVTPHDVFGAFLETLGRKGADDGQ